MSGFKGIKWGKRPKQDNNPVNVDQIIKQSKRTAAINQSMLDMSMMFTNTANDMLAQQKRK